MFRSLLVDNGFRYLFNPLLGALGGLVGWSLFVLVLAQMDEPSEMFERLSYFAFMGLAVAVACNLLRSIQDGAGPGRLIGQAMVAGLVGGIGGLAAGGIIHLLGEMAGASLDSFLPRLACYLLVGTIVGLSSRITSLDRFTWLAAVGGFLGGLFAVIIWVLLEKVSDTAAAYATLLIPSTLGFGIGAATYSLPSFVSGGSLSVLTGQFRGQGKNIEDDAIVIGNNKRELQWALPKWEGIQDPHAKVIVRNDGKGVRHLVMNMTNKTVVVVRDNRKFRVKTKSTMELEDADVLVLATGKNFVKVRYNQKVTKE